MTQAVVPSDVPATVQSDVRTEPATPVQASSAPVVQRKARKPFPSSKPIEECSEGTRALFDWAAWLKQNGLELPEGRVTFTKDTLRLVVHQYRLADGRPILALLMMDDSLPKTIVRGGVVVQQGQSRIREFRELKEDLPTIFAKTAERGWVQQIRGMGR